MTTTTKFERANKAANDIQKLLNNEHIMIDDIRVTEDDLHDTMYVVISVLWGDWKHEHAYLRYLLTERGYEHTGYIVTEEDGGDCYSADHYIKVA